MYINNIVFICENKILPVIFLLSSIAEILGTILFQDGRILQVVINKNVNAKALACGWGWKWGCRGFHLRGCRIMKPECLDM